MIVSNVIDIWKHLEDLQRGIRNAMSDTSISLFDLLFREINPKIWLAMEDFLVFLKRFYDTRTSVSESVYPSLRLVLPLYHQLKSIFIEKCIATYLDIKAPSVLPINASGIRKGV